MLHKVSLLPIVHEDIRLPQLAGGNPNILHISIFRLIPSHVGVRPFLRDGRVRNPFSDGQKKTVFKRKINPPNSAKHWSSATDSFHPERDKIC